MDNYQIASKRQLQTLNNLRPYLGNIFLVMFTEFFDIATMIFTAYVRDDSKTNVQNKENLPQCKKNRVRNILAIYPLD